MDKIEFTLLVNEILDEYDCKLYGLIYNSEGICEIRYTDDYIYNEISKKEYEFESKNRNR